jgi:hypothetical protein
VLIPHAGGGIHTPEGILHVVKEELAAVRDPSRKEKGTDLFSERRGERT